MKIPLILSSISFIIEGSNGLGYRCVTIFQAKSKDINWSIQVHIVGHS